ncbi:MAG TPA: hypothetical protein VMS96_12050 [Terriglobales bacterium]|nr:hypothetical protein [Terriglobales bacterium]
MAEPQPPLPYQPEQGETAWVPIGIGAAIMVLAIVAVVVLGRSKPTGQAGVDPYAAKLAISDLKMSAAENFVGGTVSYLEGKITNNGDQPVLGASLEVTFRNSLGEVVQKETMPVRALQAHSVTGTPEMFDLRLAPLQPGKTIDFRLTFEHISNDWNREYPQVKVVSVTTK